MTREAVTRALGIAVCVLAGAGCAAKAHPTVTPLPADLIVLLPDDDGTVGGAVVSNGSGSVELTGGRASTRVTRGATPALVEVMAESEVDGVFGEALKALPPRPRHFTLYFHLDSPQLTLESQALLAEIRRALDDRPAPEIVAIGHTDSSGKADANFALGLKRAEAVRTLLSDVVHATIAIASHGESDPLVPTADNVLEPRNRRVEITVR